MCIRDRIKSENFEVYFKERSLYLNQIRKLSKRLSKEKKILDGIYPKIRREDRVNIYEYGDYTRFGDRIIKQFLDLYPIDEWGIDWSKFSENYSLGASSVQSLLQ